MGRELLNEYGPSLLAGQGCNGLTATAILYAAQFGFEEMCEVLVAHGGVQVFEKGRDIYKQGPAEYAEKGGHLQLALHLKELESRTRKTKSVLEQHPISEKHASESPTPQCPPKRYRPRYRTDRCRTWRF